MNSCRRNKAVVCLLFFLILVKCIIFFKDPILVIKVPTLLLVALFLVVQMHPGLRRPLKKSDEDQVSTSILLALVLLPHDQRAITRRNK